MAPRGGGGNQTLHQLGFFEVFDAALPWPGSAASKNTPQDTVLHTDVARSLQTHSCRDSSHQVVETGLGESVRLSLLWHRAGKEPSC